MAVRLPTALLVVGADSGISVFGLFVFIIAGGKFGAGEPVRQTTPIRQIYSVSQRRSTRLEACANEASAPFAVRAQRTSVASSGASIRRLGMHGEMSGAFVLLQTGSKERCWTPEQALSSFKSGSQFGVFAIALASSTSKFALSFAVTSTTAALIVRA